MPADTEPRYFTLIYCRWDGQQERFERGKGMASGFGMGCCQHIQK
jgi:hypothetical protein